MQLLTSKRVVLAVVLAVTLVGTMGLVSADTNATTVDGDSEMTPGESTTDAMPGDMIEWMNDHMSEDHLEWMNDHMSSGQAPCH